MRPTSGGRTPGCARRAVTLQRRLHHQTGAASRAAGRAIRCHLVRGAGLPRPTRRTGAVPRSRHTGGDGRRIRHHAGVLPTHVCRRRGGLPAGGRVAVRRLHRPDGCCGGRRRARSRGLGRTSTPRVLAWPDSSGRCGSTSTPRTATRGFSASRPCSPVRPISPGRRRARVRPPACVLLTG